MSRQLVPLGRTVLDWYDEHARDLPWRNDAASPWAVMVSEFMLQQTPVARVIPMWQAWMQRWPQPADLAADSPGAAVRMWGKLGYPRRALRLHSAAVVITGEHGGVVPDQVDALKALPGVGNYTAAAIAAFAYRKRVAVVDTNVRRVLHRAVLGAAAAGAATTRADFELAEALLPAAPATAARTSVAVMELGALICTAAAPACPQCPIRSRCAWVLAGQPAYDGPARRVQRFTGTDRQVRGRLLDVLRGTESAVDGPALDVVWPDDQQRERALAGLLADGLVMRRPDGTFTLPG